MIDFTIESMSNVDYKEEIAPRGAAMKLPNLQRQAVPSVEADVFRRLSLTSSVSKDSEAVP